MILQLTQNFTSHLQNYHNTMSSSTQHLLNSSFCLCIWLLARVSRCKPEAPLLICSRQRVCETAGETLDVLFLTVPSTKELQRTRFEVTGLKTKSRYHLVFGILLQGDIGVMNNVLGLLQTELSLATGKHAYFTYSTCQTLSGQIMTKYGSPCLSIRI